MGIESVRPPTRHPEQAMQRILILTVAALVLGASAQAGDVFVTRDAQGRLVYTDKPESLPAEKIDVQTQQTDIVEVQQRADQQKQANAKTAQASSDAAKRATETRKAAELSAEDRAKRCTDARAHYQAMMSSYRIYEQGETEGERRYLTSEEIDRARADAKKLMDEFCSES
jgi:hypothetical protein